VGWKRLGIQHSDDQLPQHRIPGEHNRKPGFDLIFEYDSNHLGHATLSMEGRATHSISIPGMGGLPGLGQPLGIEIHFLHLQPVGYWIQLERNLDNVVHLAIHDDRDYLNALMWELRPADEWAVSTAYAPKRLRLAQPGSIQVQLAHTSTSGTNQGLGSWTTYWSVNTWALSTTYSAGDYVWHNYVRFICKSTHTSASTSEPGVGGSWTT